jgi:hypothetical protein
LFLRLSPGSWSFLGSPWPFMIKDVLNQRRWRITLGTWALGIQASNLRQVYDNSW